MKILIFSDTHASRHCMVSAVKAVQPDAIVHLGDHYADGQTLQEEFPRIPVHQVPGNCDRYRCPPGTPEVLCYDIGGVRIYMTHGHRHHVKMGLGALLADARSMGAQAVLYGHTHVADCYREADGLWVLNPGPGTYAGGAGLLVTEEGNIQSIRLLKPEQWEEML